MSTKDEFFWKDYEIPTTTSKYSRIETDKELKIRILWKPLIGWQYFNTDKKPQRSLKPFEKLIKPAISQFTNKPQGQSEFWAFRVYNYETEQIEVFETTKNRVKEGIMDLFQDDEWGDPTWYDLKISRSWKGKDTKYSVLPWKPWELTDEIKQLDDDTYVNIDALLVGDDPFKEEQEWIEELPWDQD